MQAWPVSYYTIFGPDYISTSEIEETFSMYPSYSTNPSYMTVVLYLTDSATCERLSLPPVFSFSLS